MERALGLFDNPQQEWADYIAFLSRLQKALQAHPQDIDVIPNAATVARRLAQCLNPSLPSGVHQKALEIYGTVFAVQGQQLAVDLPVFLPGISPTLTFASLAVRPLFLSLIEDYVLKLPLSSLRPALKALILSLLPGLEEETSEDFERVLNVLKKIRDLFDHDFSVASFWQSCFLASITCPSRRLGVLAYLTRYLPKFGGNMAADTNTTDDIAAVTDPEPGLLIRCFATGLSDKQVLVQRTFLDLLVTHLPIHATFLQRRVVPEDLHMLMRSASTVVLRRDMSLNKRLWTWFLGPEDQSGHGNYFLKYGAEGLAASLEGTIERDSSNPTERGKPMRIVASLMDQEEIGGLLATALFAPLLRNVMEYEHTAPSEEAFQEVLRSAHVFFDGVESFLIWSEVLRLLAVVNKSNPSAALEDIRLARFILTTFNVAEEEMIQLHIPLVGLAIICILVATDSSILDPAIQNQLLEVVEILFGRMSLTSVSKSARAQGELHSGDDLGEIRRYYSDGRRPPIEGVAVKLFRRTMTLLEMNLHSDEQLAGITRIVVILLPQIPTPVFDSRRNLGAVKIISDFQNVAEDTQSSWGRISSISTLLCALSTALKLPPDEISECTAAVINAQWKFLDPQKPSHHVEAVRQLWNVHAICAQHHTGESTIVSLMLENTKGTLDTSVLNNPIEYFATLWYHSYNIGFHDGLLRGPLTIAIDSLDVESAKQWLRGVPSTSLIDIYKVAFIPLANATSTQAELVVSMKRISEILSSQSDEQWARFAGDKSLQIDVKNSPSQETLQASLVKICMSICESKHDPSCQMMALKLLRQLLGRGYKDLDLNGIETFLLTRLEFSITKSDTVTKSQLMDTLLDLMGARRSMATSKPRAKHRRTDSQPEANGVVANAAIAKPPDKLIPWLLKMIAAEETRPVLEKSVVLLCEAISLDAESIFQILINIVESVCREVQSSFARLQSAFSSDMVSSGSSEKEIILLLNGLEYALGQAHQRLLLDEQPTLSTPKSPDQPQGLFANIVSGKTVSDGKLLRNNTANNRLTVVLCFQDSVKCALQLWSWEKVDHSLPSVNSIDQKNASFQHTASKLRNRSRRMLEHLVGAEPLECLETLIGSWTRSNGSTAERPQVPVPVLDLIHTLNACRPRITMSALFNAIYSRTNPGVLDGRQRSTLSSNLTELDITAFLLHYLRSLEDDVLDEIWADCNTFLRDVLGNPMPHRRILIRLIEFIAIIAQKMENTNFGEEWKMRKELGDHFVRLLEAIFTIKPSGGSGSSLTASDTVFRNGTLALSARNQGSPELADILLNNLPAIEYLLGESVVTQMIRISTQVIAPKIKSKAYPQNMSQATLLLLQRMSKVPNAGKFVKKDVLEAFNDYRFFQSSPNVARTGWLPLLRQLLLTEKPLVADLLSKLTPPTAAGLMFGVGANAARLEADRKTQLTLRRLATLVLAADDEAFASSISTIANKIEEASTATRISSPSSATRAEIFMLVRALILRCSSVQLAPLWPVVSADLQNVIQAVVDGKAEEYSVFVSLQATKLLDLLLLLQPDGFQLHEWLFLTDTLDAMYPPDDWRPSALADAVADTGARSPSRVTPGLLRPRLNANQIPDDMIIDELVRPYLGHLSIQAFENNYGLAAVDRGACIDDLLEDLFNDETIVS